MMVSTISLPQLQSLGPQMGVYLIQKALGFFQEMPEDGGLRGPEFSPTNRRTGWTRRADPPSRVAQVVEELDAVGSQHGQRVGLSPPSGLGVWSSSNWGIRPSMRRNSWRVLRFLP